jgi:hypothetical protein
VTSEVLTALAVKITVIEYNLVQTPILEEPAAFFFQVKEISSATCQETVSHQINKILMESIT